MRYRPGLDAARAAIQAEQDSLGRALVEFAAEHELTIESSGQALANLASFVSDNKVHVILNEAFPDSPLERSSLDRKLTRLVARFITVKCFQSPELRMALAGLTEGILLQDTLLMRDIPEAGQRFQDLVVALDTGALFAAMELTGVANAVAAKEGLTLLRRAGARTIAFSRTIDEMRRILAVYEQHLGTAEGRLSLYTTALTQHVLTKRLSPADIRIISSTIENRLEKIGVKIRELPHHEAPYTLGEKALAASLADVGRPDPDQPRVRHDVDCVAGILTLRKGRVSTSVERSGAIFCTTSGRVVRTVQQWYFAEAEEQTLPPIIHQAALTSIAWLKYPAAAPDVKMYELAALCVAALRPTRATMAKCTENLRRLRNEGTITDDETAAIVASELMEPLLARLDEEFEPDADSVQGAIERVRDTYRLEAVAAAEQAVSKAQSDAAADRQAAEEAVHIARTEAELAERSAADAIAIQNNVVASVERLILGLASIVSTLLFWFAVLGVLLAAILSIPGTFDSLGGTVKWIARAIILFALALGAYSQVKGPSLVELRRGFQRGMAEWIRSRLMPADPNHAPRDS